MLGRFIDKLRRIIAGLKWKPDWSNPDHIRFLTIREYHRSGIKMILGIIILGACMGELSTLFLGLPAIIDYFEKNEIGFPQWICLIGPAVVLSNGIILMVFAGFKGIQFLKDEDDYPMKTKQKGSS